MGRRRRRRKRGREGIGKKERKAAGYRREGLGKGGAPQAKMYHYTTEY